MDKYQKLTLWILLGTALAVPASADEALSAAIGRCAAIAEEAGRLTCYDALAQQLASDEDIVNSAEPQPPALDAPAPSGPQPLTDDIGRERVEPIREKEQAEYAGLVARCERNPQSGQHYFFFENGQVWKQSTYRRLSLRNCQFEVTLSEDAFGYEMYIPSRDRRFRVTRVR